jgi:tetratricopeptide (TPR) repeat protein
MKSSFLRQCAVLVLGIAAITSGASGAGSSEKSVNDELDIGYRLARRGYWQEALAHYQRADRLDPDNVEILNNLAVALEAVADYEQAKATYERARALAPGDRYLQRNYNDFMEFYETYVKPREAEEQDKQETTEKNEESNGEESEDS